MFRYSQKNLVHFALSLGTSIKQGLKKPDAFLQPIRLLQHNHKFDGAALRFKSINLPNSILF